MDFNFLSVNSVKLLGLLLASNVSALALISGVSALDKYSHFLSAGAATILFFGGGWAFFQVLKKAQEPLCITILPTALIEVNKWTGVRRQWPFAEITAYRFFPAFRGVATLRLTLRSGKKVRLNAGDMSLLDNSNVAQFEMMVQAFKDAWNKHKQA